MRDILVEEARRNAALKRSGKKATLITAGVAAPGAGLDVEILDLHEAMKKLAEKDTQGFNVILLRYFAGLTLAEVADVMGVSRSSIDRKWRFLRTWLARELNPSPAPGL